jgi:hypothetical protein
VYPAGHRDAQWGKNSGSGQRQVTPKSGLHWGRCGVAAGLQPGYGHLVRLVPDLWRGTCLSRRMNILLVHWAGHLAASAVAAGWPLGGCWVAAV